MSRAIKTLALCGVGNTEGIRLALTVNREQGRWDRIIALDDDARLHGSARLGVDVSGPLTDLRTFDPGTVEVVNLVTRTTERRAKVQHRLTEFGVPLVSLIHPCVDVFGVKLAADVTVYQNSSLGPESRLGPASVVLIGAVIGHGANVGEGCVIAPNAVVNARVTLGDRVYVGANATILPDVAVGEGATIGANSLVCSDVPPGATVIGVPGQVMSAQPNSSLNPIASAKRSVAAFDPDVTPAMIARTLGDLLGIELVHPDANFFELGCTSLRAVELCQKLRNACRRDPQVVDLYRFPTARELARFLDEGNGVGQALERAQSRAALRRQIYAPT
jgi:acetyltransferase-like isoleucine patch superfamily enzyme